MCPGPSLPLRAALALLATVLLSACATGRPDQIDQLLGQAFRAAEAHYEFEQDPEAALLVDAIAAVDPSYPGLRELDEDLDPDARRGVSRGWMGVSLAIRPQHERSRRARALLWLPDRILDLIDVATFGVHFGVGAFADAHVTRALQVGGGVRTTGGLGLHDGRSLGLKSQGEAGLAAIAAGSHSYAGALIGTSGAHSVVDNGVGLHRPSSPLYQKIRDYWAIGGSATLGIIGAEAELHPLQFVDFVAGFVGIDFLNDDFSHTRRLALGSVESQLVGELHRIAASGRLIEAYVEAKRMNALPTSTPRHRTRTERVAPPAAADDRQD